ncbi:hypothetical protein GP2143_01042 [marine gamma proteobacterium HTCC2143]|uniref:Uncharacterized protein n=1 Tax=marine gamma proteobacterium HTCC2143 TaxID=247633 RepID=A0YF86_9GAMM|nr:hypothetical protein GP2143_01042 [marine gamma proteobacterium HTCC2143]
MRAERARETDGFPAGMSGSGGSEGSPEGHQPWSNGFVLLPGSIEVTISRNTTNGHAPCFGTNA